jgi:hypothetical protein
MIFNVNDINKIGIYDLDNLRLATTAIILTISDKIAITIKYLDILRYFSVLSF